MYDSFQAPHKGSHLLILAGVHGDEYEPIVAAKRLLKIMPEILKHGKITIVPVVNHSAFMRAARTGEDDLDLARICPGNLNGSISEVVAADVSDLISRADYLIDMHSGGNLFEIDALAGYVLHDVPAVLEKQRQMARAFNLKTVWGTSSKLNGRTLSVARDHNVPAIYTEFGGGGGFKEIIAEAYVQGCINVMTLLGMSEANVPESNVRFEVEDYRDESGYLQIMLPAPCDGLFESVVRLGDLVKTNRPIGTIAGLTSDVYTTVDADQDGMVFMLRAIPSVKKGETLGGILPVAQPGKYTIR